MNPVTCGWRRLASERCTVALCWAQSLGLQVQRRRVRSGRKASPATASAHPLHRPLIDLADIPGADPSGAADSTDAFRTAANAVPRAGGAIHVPGGRYRLSGSVLLRGGTRVFSFSGATLFTAGMENMARIVHSSEHFYGAAFGNENFSAGAITDRDIVIENMAFDWGDNPGSNSHVLRFVKASGVRVRWCRFTGRNYGDAVAFLGCDDITVEGCYAEGFTNCALDTWSGCSRIKFLHNTLNAGRNCAQIININAVTSTGGDATAADFEVVGNQISLAGSSATGIFLATLGQNSVVRNGSVIGNTIVGDPTRRGWGIVGRGLGGRFVVAENRLDRPRPSAADMDQCRLLRPSECDAHEQLHCG